MLYCIVRPQLEYASTVCYHHITTDIYKVEAIQRMAIMWVTRDYRYTSSVTAMLNDLNWRALDQRRIDSRLMMMHIYKVTNDLVAIPVSLYLVRNTITSRHIHSLVYKQIQTFKDYYRFIGGRAGGRTDALTSDGHYYSWILLWYLQC